MATERSFVAPAIHDDTWIEQWAAVYLDAHLNRVMRAHQVRFEAFLLAPIEILAAVQTPRVYVERCGLLPAQRLVQAWLDREDAISKMAERVTEALEREGACCSNGRLTEKLRHRVWPRNPKKRIVEEIS